MALGAGKGARPLLATVLLPTRELQLTFHEQELATRCPNGQSTCRGELWGRNSFPGRCGRVSRCGLSLLGWRAFAGTGVALRQLAHDRLDAQPWPTAATAVAATTASTSTGTTGHPGAHRRVCKAESAPTRSCAATARETVPFCWTSAALNAVSAAVLLPRVGGRRAHGPRETPALSPVVR